MTAYFDERGSQFEQTRRAITAGLSEGAVNTGLLSALASWEMALVIDVTIAAESPGCPEAIRDRIHQAVLDYGLETRPLTAEAADVADAHQGLERLSQLLFHLHSIFHDLGCAGVEGFNDDPRAPLLRLNSLGEQRRERMAADQEGRGDTLGARRRALFEAIPPPPAAGVCGPGCAGCAECQGEAAWTINPDDWPDDGE